MIPPPLQTRHLTKQSYIDSLRHSLVPRRIQMKVITSIIRRQQPLRHPGIPHRLIKVHNSIKPRLIPRTIPHPLIHPIPRHLPLRRPVPLPRPRHGRDGRTYNRDAVPVQTRDDLVVGLDDAVAYARLGGGGTRGGADVVDADEEDGPADAGVGEDVPVDAAEAVGAQTVGEDAVPSCGLIEDGDA